MRFKTVYSLLSLLAFATGIAKADEVTDWNRIMLNALLGPPVVAAPLRAALRRDRPGLRFRRGEWNRAALHPYPRPASGSSRSLRAGCRHPSGVCQPGSPVSEPDRDV